jgi:microcystin-dependent protein
MSEPFLAEVRILGFDFAPRGHAFCDGQLLPIDQNQSLFSLLGTTYGGDGVTTFALPDLRGRAPMHADNGHTLGQKAGEETHTITIAEMPDHTHALQASSAVGDNPNPGNNQLADSAPNELYAAPQNLSAMRAGTVANVGGGQSHENRQPYLAVRFCIALQGLFPSPN